MLIALLAVLGVDLVVLVAFAVLVLGRRRWLMRQPGEFTGAIRVSSGSYAGLSEKWKRGSGRLVRDVLIWNRAPLLFRSEVVIVERALGERQARKGEVKRLGDAPVVVEFMSDDATIEVAADAEDRRLVTGRFVKPV